MGSLRMTPVYGPAAVTHAYTYGNKYLYHYPKGSRRFTRVTVREANRILARNPAANIVTQPREIVQAYCDLRWVVVNAGESRKIPWDSVEEFFDRAHRAGVYDL